MLGPYIARAGGIAEQPQLISNASQGIKFLQNGYIIKRDHSYEGRHVYFPEQTFTSSEKFRDEVNKFETNFIQTYSQFQFFAMHYNSALPMLGEIRVFIAYGQVLKMTHTVPPSLHNPKTGIVVDNYSAAGHIIKVKDIIHSKR